MTFSSGASIVPFDYVNATKDNAVYLVGGVLKTNIDGRDVNVRRAVRRGPEALEPRRAVDQHHGPVVRRRLRRHLLGRARRDGRRQSRPNL